MTGSISPANNNGSIRIRFTYLRRSYQIGNLGRFDDPIALRRANILASQISLDIAAGHFDETLSKYKPQTASKPVQKDVNWSKAIQDYIIHRKNLKDCGVSFLLDMEVLSKKLINLNASTLTKPIKLVEWLAQSQTAYMCEKSFSYLNLTANWLIAREEIEKNPFSKLKKLIPDLEDEWDINPFSREELDQIIQGFKTNPHYKHYWQLVAFLFYSGCRPCEAIPLKWVNVGSDKIALKESRSQRDHRKRLKTQKTRVIRISPKVNEILETLQKKNDLVFPSPTGKYIDWHNFTNRGWKKVIEGLGIEYRNPYQMRHTFITEAIKANISSTLIARHCGTSTEMIERHYLGDVSDTEILF